MPDSTIEFFRVLAKVLFRCWILGFALLFVWLGAILLGGQTIHRLHGPLFGLSLDQLHVVHYCGIGLFKLFIIGLFFIPCWPSNWSFRTPRIDGRKAEIADNGKTQ